MYLYYTAVDIHYTMINTFMYNVYITQFAPDLAKSTIYYTAINKRTPIHV